MQQRPFTLFLKTLFIFVSFISLSLPSSYAMEFISKKKDELEQRKRERYAEGFTKELANDNPFYFRERQSTLSVSEQFRRPTANFKGDIKDKILNEATLVLMHVQLIPSTIGRLSNLKAIDIYSVHLTYLPPEIGKLVKLETMTLNTPNLSSIPTAIKSLTNLTSLAIYSPKIKELPPGVAKFKKLTTLNLMWCSGLEKIASLESVEQLNPKLTIYLNYTPLRNIFGEATITPSYIIYHRNLQIGRFVNMILASQSEECLPQALKKSIFRILPKELRSSILEFFITKLEQEKQGLREKN